MSQNLPLSNKIDESSSKTTKFHTITTKFGNGFGQRAPDGINNKVDTWLLNWTNISPTDKDTLVNIFDLVGGWDYLLWTPYSELTQKRFIITESGYTTTPKTGNLFDVSVELEQVF